MSNMGSQEGLFLQRCLSIPKDLPHHSMQGFWTSLRLPRAVAGSGMTGEKCDESDQRVDGKVTMPSLPVDSLTTYQTMCRVKIATQCAMVQSARPINGSVRGKQRCDLVVHSVKDGWLAKSPWASVGLMHESDDEAPVPRQGPNVKQNWEDAHGVG